MLKRNFEKTDKLRSSPEVANFFAENKVGELHAIGETLSHDLHGPQGPSRAQLRHHHRVIKGVSLTGFGLWGGGLHVVRFDAANEVRDGFLWMKSAIDEVA